MSEPQRDPSAYHGASLISDSIILGSGGIMMAIADAGHAFFTGSIGAGLFLVGMMLVYAEWRREGK